jgi:hypothetical protein
MTRPARTPLAIIPTCPICGRRFTQDEWDGRALGWVHTVPADHELAGADVHADCCPCGEP